MTVTLIPSFHAVYPDAETAKQAFLTGNYFTRLFEDGSQSNFRTRFDFNDGDSICIRYRTDMNDWNHDTDKSMSIDYRFSVRFTLGGNHG
jgi:hypothetical protein